MTPLKDVSRLLQQRGEGEGGEVGSTCPAIKTIPRRPYSFATWQIYNILTLWLKYKNVGHQCTPNVDHQCTKYGSPVYQIWAISVPQMWATSVPHVGHLYTPNVGQQFTPNMGHQCSPNVGHQSQNVGQQSPTRGNGRMGDTSATHIKGLAFSNITRLTLIQLTPYRLSYQPT